MQGIYEKQNRFRKQTLRTLRGRAVCAPENALVHASVDAPFACRETHRSARRKTSRSARRETRHSARRETRRSARRETRGLHAGRRAGARRVRAGCAPRVRARGAGRPVRPFSSRSGLPELRGQAAGGRRHARRGSQERGASPALLRALARLEPKPGRREVPPGFAFLFRRQKESGAKHTKKQDATVQESGARVCVQEPTAAESS